MGNSAFVSTVMVLVICLHSSSTLPLDTQTEKGDEVSAKEGVMLEKLGVHSGKKPTTIPEECRKEYFVKNFVNEKKPMSAEDFNELQTKCSIFYPDCADYPGTLSVTYYKDVADKKVFINFQVSEMLKRQYYKGCWGYVLKKKDDEETKFFYFNFDEKKSVYDQRFYFKLAFSYEFTVTPLPTGLNLTIATQAPTGCELEVIEDIYNKLHDGTMFKGCSPPDFEMRRRAAAVICQEHPNNAAERYEMTKNNLVQKSCVFELAINNETS